jgi:ABC-type Na+ efflux pump permease subunit
MTAFFTAGWSGMPMIEDLERGVVDRFLVSPVRRSSLITGRLAQASLQIVIQTLIIVGLAIAVGAGSRTAPSGSRSSRGWRSCSGPRSAPCRTAWRCWLGARRR